MAQFVSLAVVGSIYLLFALGLTLSWGTLDVLNLAHGSIMMFGAFIAYLVAEKLRLPLPLLLVIAILTSAIITLLLDTVVFGTIRNRVRDRRQAELLTLIAGVGIAGIPLSIAQNLTEDGPFGISYVHPKVFNIGSAPVSTVQISIVVLGLGLSISLAVWVSRSRTGRALRSLAFDAETCQLMGVNTRALSALTMFVAGGLAGLAGVLLMLRLGAIAPESGDTLLLKGFAIVILGGVGSVWGTLVAAFILSTAETAATTWTSGTWTDAISFGIIILVILLRPQGLFGRTMAERV